MVVMFNFLVWKLFIATPGHTVFFQGWHPGHMFGTSDQTNYPRKSPGKATSFGILGSSLGSRQSVRLASQAQSPLPGNQGHEKYAKAGGFTTFFGTRWRWWLVLNLYMHLIMLKTIEILRGVPSLGVNLCSSFHIQFNESTHSWVRHQLDHAK